MYSGTHFTGGLGTSQCSRPMATGKRHSCTFSFAKSITKPFAESKSQSQPEPQSIAKRHLRTRVECYPCLLQHCYNQLQWRLQSQQERPELYRAVLEHEPGPNRCRPRRTSRERRSVVYGCCLHRRHSFTLALALAFADSITQS